MKILIAEDDLTSRTILTGMLRKWNFEPVIAENGQQAWDLMQRDNPPLIVILDWNMPFLDGLEVCRKIRCTLVQNPPYIILLTAKDKKSDIVTGLDAGANDYISKPYDKDELHARIRVGKRVISLQLDLLKIQQSLSYDAMHDALTGALNRRAILDALEREILRANRRGSFFSLGLVDIDHFKQVNDRYGHLSGDDILKGLVTTMASNLRGYDLVGRYGGEEFLVIAPESKGSRGEGLYEGLRRAVEHQVFFSRCGRSLQVTVSIGVTSMSGESSVDDLLAQADAALYEAKESGRNRIVYSTS
ncbi:MAG: diguanylate cyclase [Desulfuromonadales bacterium]|nr:diguanylate cyclase [Desulfuromonadales bacterium]MBN2791568.1 diguanylate cyclase [Desulfuromonadales bacterium]